MPEPFHTILTSISGRADLECIDHAQVLVDLPILFDPVALVFEVQLPASHDLMQCLAEERNSVEFVLSKVVLVSEDKEVRLEVESVEGLSRQNPLWEWPESNGLCAFLAIGAAASATRRLVLGPAERRITFKSPTLLDKPYRVYYRNACTGIHLPSSLLELQATSIQFFSDSPAKGFIGAVSDGDFFAHEDQIHSALQLIHGRLLPLVLKVQGRQISFYGYRVETQRSWVPLVKDSRDARTLTDAVLAAIVAMPRAKFESMRFALSFFLLGKEADIAAEVRYLLLMICVEAMDQEYSLQELSTSQLLGISTDAAKLLNAMRHQLTHGKGDHKQAFDEVLFHQFEGRMPPLEPAFRDCISDNGKCDFVALWFRLIERLDAFWCAYLGVPELVARQRYSRASILPLPLAKLSPAATSKGSRNKNIDELTSKNEKLMRRNAELNQQLADCQKRCAELRRQNAPR